jgi:hypothetical protein
MPCKSGIQREEPDGRKPPMTGDVEYQTHSRQNIPFRRQWIQVEKERWIRFFNICRGKKS